MASWFRKVDVGADQQGLYVFGPLLNGDRVRGLRAWLRDGAAAGAGFFQVGVSVFANRPERSIGSFQAGQEIIPHGSPSDVDVPVFGFDGSVPTVLDLPVHVRGGPGSRFVAVSLNAADDTATLFGTVALDVEQGDYFDSDRFRFGPAASESAGSASGGGGLG